MAPAAMLIGTLAPGARDVSCRPDPAMAGASGRIDLEEAAEDRVFALQLQTGEVAVLRDQRGGGEDRVHVHHLAALDPDAGQHIVADHQLRHRPRVADDVPRRELAGNVAVHRSGQGGEEDHVVAPLPDQLGLVDAHRRGGQHGQPLPADLPAVAIRAVQNVPAPALCQPRDLRQIVPHAGGGDQTAGGEPAAVVRLHLESRSGLADLLDDGGAHLDAVACHFGAGPAEEFQRVGALVAQHPMHVAGEAVARAAAVEHQDPPQRPAQHQGRAQPGSAAADDNDIPFVVFHGPRVREPMLELQVSLQKQQVEGGGP